MTFAGVIIAGDDAPEWPTTLLCHLEQDHPAVRRVLVCGIHVGKLDHASSARIHAVLRTPWHLRGLARAVALDGARVERTLDLLMLVQMSAGK